MTASKTLTAAITAATILGAVSFVFAQTTDSAAPTADRSEQTTTPRSAPSLVDSDTASADVGPRAPRN
jgi:hypothetical protein